MNNFIEDLLNLVDKIIEKFKFFKNKIEEC